MNDGAAAKADGTRVKTRTAANGSPSRRNITASLDADRSITPSAPDAFPREQESRAEHGHDGPIPGEMRNGDRRRAPRHGVQPVERPSALPVDVDAPPMWHDEEVPERALILPLGPRDAHAVGDAADRVERVHEREAARVRVERVDPSSVLASPACDRLAFHDPALLRAISDAAGQQMMVQEVVRPDDVA